MNPQQEIEALKTRVAELEQALALVNLQVLRVNANADARAVVLAFNENRHFRLEVSPQVSDIKNITANTVHARCVELVIDEPDTGLAKLEGK